LDASDSVTAAPLMLGRYELGKIEGAELLTDPASIPRSFTEAPELAALVQQGKLPPVGERIGQDPIVLKPVHSIGTYGGTLRRGFISANRSGPDEELFLSGPDSLLWWNYESTLIVPNIARGFQLSDDAKTLTIQLRRGMRWSDGAPFTADDILFWYEDMYLNTQLIPAPHPRMQLFGEPIVIEKVDRYTVRFVSPGPHPLLPRILAIHSGLNGQASEIGGAEGMGVFAPKHYLSRLHPRYAPGGQTAVDGMATNAGFPDWASFFMARNDWTQNADLPVVTPWTVVRGKEKRTQNWVLERNPYSIWVDTEGNQLPYLDRISASAAESVKVMNERAAAGEYDFQSNVFAQLLPTLKENEAKGRYRVFLSPNEGNTAGIRLNLAYEADPIIGDLIRTVEFRRALAIAIDRDEISEAFFSGMAPPNSIAPYEGDPYFPGPEYRTRWATTDVGEANRLLDEIGLDDRDPDGYRLRSDGERVCLECTCQINFSDLAGIAEMVKRQWKQIGIDMSIHTVSPAQSAERANANQIQIAVFNQGSEDPFIYPDELFPSSFMGFSGAFGPPYIRWFLSGGEEGSEPPAKMREVMELWRKGFAAPDAERVPIGKKMYEVLVDEVFGIGLLGSGLGSYGVYVAKTNLGNVPARHTNVLSAPGNTFPMTFYFDQGGRASL
jgi:peptide/nickel transport system substrate-binding protein